MDRLYLDLYKLEQLVWMGMQTDSPNVPMYKVMLHKQLDKICKAEKYVSTL